ncbi:UNVERIFIED_CONTAM: hypothetical protein RMT77_008619 [Armadillidium vulgare]
MARAMVPEVKVISEEDEDDEDGNKKREESLLRNDLDIIHEGAEPTRNPKMLAPPPRFVDDDDEENAWIDVDHSGFMDYPELLATYTSLRPRLSYRLTKKSNPKSEGN